MLKTMKGSTLLRHLWAWRNVIIFVTMPLVLSPLIICYMDDPVFMKPMRCAYVLGVMVIFWVTEALPPGITSLIPMVASPLLQLEKSGDLAPFYLDDTNMAIIASILVVKAFEESELHKRFAFAVLRVVGVKPRWLLAGIMLVSWLLSMFLSNAMAATLIIPVVLQINSDLRQAVRETINKNLSQTMLTEHSVAASVLAFRSLNSAMKMIRRYEIMLVIAVAYSCAIGGSATLIGTPENMIIRDEITNLYVEHNCTNYNPVNFGSWIVWGLPASMLFLPIAWLWILVYFTGFRYAFGLKRGAPSYMEQHADKLLGVVRLNCSKLPPMGPRQWIVIGHIVVMIVLFFTRLLNTPPPFGWEVIAPGYVHESTASCLVAISLFVFPVSLAKEGDEDGGGHGKLKRPKKALKWSEEDGGRAFNIVLLIGGGLAVSHVAITSGFAEMISDYLYEANTALTKEVKMVVITIFNVVLTELMSIAASVHFILPILTELTEKQGQNPLLYMLPTALTSSFAFMLPTATAPNAVAFSLTKGLHVIDLISLGFVLDIMGIGIVLLATNTWGAYYFEFYEPAWIDVGNHTSICRAISWSQVAY